MEQPVIMGSGVFFVVLFTTCAVFGAVFVACASWMAQRFGRRALVAVWMIAVAAVATAVLTLMAQDPAAPALSASSFRALRVATVFLFALPAALGIWALATGRTGVGSRVQIRFWGRGFAAFMAGVPLALGVIMLVDLLGGL